MRELLKNKVVVAGLLLQICVVSVIVLALDGSATAVLEGLRGAWVSSATYEDLIGLQERVDRLHSDVQVMSTQVAEAALRRHPDLQSIKALAGESHLQVRRVERVTSSAKGQEVLPTYTLTVTGAPHDEISFLHHLEQDFVLESDQTTLQRADESGRTTALTLSIRLEKE